MTPTSTIIEEDAVFVESFFAIPDEEIESKLHLQSPWLLRLELDCAKSLTVNCLCNMSLGALQKASKPISSLFGVKTSLSDAECWEAQTKKMTVWAPSKRTSSYDNSKTHHAQFSQPPRCKRNQVSVLDTARRSSYHRRWEHPHREKQRVGADGVNLKTVMCIDSVDFMRTYSNSCLEIFNVLSEAVDLYALRVFQLQGARCTLNIFHVTLVSKS